MTHRRGGAEELGSVNAVVGRSLEDSAFKMTVGFIDTRCGAPHKRWVVDNDLCDFLSIGERLRFLERNSSLDVKLIGLHEMLALQ